MTNLTITVDEETLRRARIRALEEGSSVNAVLREYLSRYAEDRGRAERPVHTCHSPTVNRGFGRVFAV
ncbi:MAG: hypothetical protein FJW85_07835 [Actinobacteria bacterium]|jgi:plasmid stability protein|nr:hypothetical protein [Actinomycetota bacterium]